MVVLPEVDTVFPYHCDNSLYGCVPLLVDASSEDESMLRAVNSAT